MRVSLASKTRGQTTRGWAWQNSLSTGSCCHAPWAGTRASTKRHWEAALRWKPSLGSWTESTPGLPQQWRLHQQTNRSIFHAMEHNDAINARNRYGALISYPISSILTHLPFWSKLYIHKMCILSLLFRSLIVLNIMCFILSLGYRSTGHIVLIREMRNVYQRYYKRKNKTNFFIFAVYMNNLSRFMWHMCVTKFCDKLNVETVLSFWIRSKDLEIMQALCIPPTIAANHIGF